MPLLLAQSANAYYQVCFNCQFSANDKFKASLFIFIITKIFVTVLSHWVSLNQLNADFFYNCISYHIWDRKAVSCKKLPKVAFGKCSAEFMAIIIIAVVIVIIDTFPQFFFLLIGEEIFTFKVNQDIYNLNVIFGSNLYISGKYFWQYHSILDV